MATQEDRERESRESEETKFDEAVEHESEERESLGERLGDDPLTRGDAEDSERESSS